MHDALNAFRECGFASFLCVLIGLVGLGVGLVSVALLAMGKRKAASMVGLVAIALGSLAMGAGVLGRQTGLAKTEAAVAGASIDPGQKERILAVGGEEANQCLKVGGASAALPFLLGALAAAAGYAARKSAG